MSLSVATARLSTSQRASLPDRFGCPSETFRGPRGPSVEIGRLRRFVALSAARMKDWMASDLSGLDLLVIQIDGIHMDEDLILVAAISVDAKGDELPLALPRELPKMPRPSSR